MDAATIPTKPGLANSLPKSGKVKRLGPKGDGTRKRMMIREVEGLVEVDLGPELEDGV